MQALADSLEVTPAALYRYFPSKADLAQALLRHVSSRIRVPPRDGRPWREWVLAAAQALRTYLRPDRISAGLLHDDVAAYPLIEALAEVLAEAGLSPRDSWSLYAHLCSLALGASSFEANFARYGKPTSALLRAQLSERGVDQSGALARMFLSAETLDADDWFVAEVTRVLDRVGECLTPVLGG
jgi:AcrR family transcriptional regulator